MKKAKARRAISPEAFLKAMQAEWRKQWQGLRKQIRQHKSRCHRSMLAQNGR
jgi:hypothetical protein